jgi:hypothetical protein
MHKRQQWEMATEAAWAAALRRETAIRPLTEHPRLSAGSIAEAAYQLGLSRSILYKLLQRYERSVRHRKGLNAWKSFLAPLTPEALRSLARISRAWPSALHRRFAAALLHTIRRDSFMWVSALIHSVRDLSTNSS